MTARRRAWGILAAAALGAIAVGLVDSWPTVGRGGDLAVAQILLGLNCVLVLVPFAVGKARRRFDLFEPSVVLGVIWVFAYILPGASIIGGADPTWAQWGGRAQGATSSLLAKALAMSALGLASMQSVYYFPTGRGPVAGEPPRWSVSSRRFRWWAGSVAIAALSLFCIMVVRVGGPAALLSNLNDRVRFFSGLNYLSQPALSLLSILLLASAIRATRGLGWNVGVVAFALFGFGINALLGSKTNLLSVLLALLVVRHYLVKPIKPLPALVLAVGGVVLALGFDLYFREFLVIRQISSIDLSASPGEVATLAWKAFSANAFLQLQGLMLIIDGVPNILPFQLEKPYVAMALMVIPRAIYPDKPQVVTEVFSRTFFGDQLAVGTSIPTSIVGEFYISLGPLGVLVGGCICGYLLRKAYHLLRQHPREPGVVAVHSLVIGTLLPWVRGDTFGPTVFFVSVAAPIVVLVLLSRYRAANVAGR